jgi:hypothetical protein
MRQKKLQKAENLPTNWVGPPVERSARLPQRLLEWALSCSFPYWALLLLDPLP